MWSVGRKRCVGQRNCRWSVVCRGEKGEWVKRPVGAVWSVGVKRASGSRGLSLECGLSGQVWRVGQRNCRWRVVCRGEKGEWVKRPVAGMWSVVAKRASGSRGLSLECGLSARKGRVGQGACRWYVVCRGEKGEWVKGPVAGMWSVGAKRASGSKGLSAECGLSGRKGRVGQRNCQRSVVCRGENAAWVKEIVVVVWFGGRKRCVGQRNCRWRVVCRAKTLRGSRELSLECGLSGQVWRVGQKNCR